MLALSVVLGTIVGAILALALAAWALVPASRQMRRGYFNAFVTGLLLAAAVEVLPNALNAVEFAGRSLVAALIPAQGAAPDSFWNALTQPVQIQLVVRSFGAAIVMVIFFRANGIQLLQESQTHVQGRRRFLLLPTARTDYVGLVVLFAGLAGYALWMGLSRGLSPGAPQSLSFDLLALVFTSSLLGVAALGLIVNFERRWWLLPAASLLLGLAAGLGALDRGEWLAIEAGLVPLVISAFCLVYGIGRLLRLLQHEIGLGWQTTLTVAIGALVLYQTRFLL